VDLDLAPNKISRVSLKGREGEITVRCRTVVNATDPCVDVVRKMEDPVCGRVARLSKRIHVVLRPDEQWRAAVAVSLGDGQHLYAVPCEDRILLGTTELEYCGDPASVVAEPEDVSYLLEGAKQFLRPEMLRAERTGPLGTGLPCDPRRMGLDSWGHHLSQDHPWAAWLRYARDST
jgi:glycerol-3-phosphate dehydrogenase